MSEPDLTVPFADLVEAVYEATNQGTETTGTTVTFEANDETADSESITVAEHDSESGELVWDTHGVLPGTYTATISTAYTEEELLVEIEPPTIEYFLEETDQEGDDYGPPESPNPVRVELTNSLGWPIAGEQVFLELVDWRGIEREPVELVEPTDEDGVAYFESFNPETKLQNTEDFSGEVYWTGTTDSTDERFSTSALNPILEAVGGEEYDIEVDGQMYRIHEYADVGESTFDVATSFFGQANVLVVAGGGGGASDSLGGGGGAGGLLFDELELTTGSYDVFVGDGGDGKGDEEVHADDGEDSYFEDIQAVGGGGGAPWENNNGNDGGSGGGGSGDSGTGGSGIEGQGNDAGDGADGPVSDNNCAGGGGGAGEPGEDGDGETGGDGGDGKYFGDVFTEQFGEDGWFAGGGGGGTGSGGLASEGGKGGGTGGAGEDRDTEYDVIPNTGGGGGGGGNSDDNNQGADGQTGVVLVRYPINA